MSHSYMQHLGFTAWRRKTALFVILSILSLLVYGIQFIKISFLYENNEQQMSKIIESQDQVLKTESNPKNVKFVFTKNNKTLGVNKRNTNTSQNKNKTVNQIIVQQKMETLETNQQLGIPYVRSFTANSQIYIPKQRIVHFDFKGAPPTILYFKKIFPLIRNLGATGVLLEYEDMFPFEGELSVVTAGNAYTLKDIQKLQKYASDSQLTIIPLIQTFGHMEFILKHKKFSKLREVDDSPQAICPSNNSSLDLIAEMAYQVINAHSNLKYLHIGCDEVFQMGECNLCRTELHEVLFLRHIKRIAERIHKKHPHLKLLVWDDMLRHLSQTSMMEFDLGKTVEPMVWVYAEDIYHFVQPTVWDKYSEVFSSAWTASAFKGAFGETLYIPDSKRHLENNLRWLDVMAEQDKQFKHGLSGVVLTGWQRYDHFAVLCELLPAGIPSLALSLTAVSNGFFNASLKQHFLSTLSCPTTNIIPHQPFLNLNTDPHLWTKLGRCMFPGSPVFRLTQRLSNVENDATEYIENTKKLKGWMTSYNIRHNYSSPLRVNELTADLTRVYNSVSRLILAATEAMTGIFDNYTIYEWIEQKIYPYVLQLEKIQNESQILKSITYWKSRPFPPLLDLQRFGVTVAQQENN